jgi:hypothetical protein
VEEKAYWRVRYWKVMEGCWAKVKRKPRPSAVKDLWIEPRIKFPKSSIRETGDRIMRVIQTTGGKARIWWTIGS